MWKGDRKALELDSVRILFLPFLEEMKIKFSPFFTLLHRGYPTSQIEVGVFLFVSALPKMADSMVKIQANC